MFARKALLFSIAAGLLTACGGAGGNPPASNPGGTLQAAGSRLPAPQATYTPATTILPDSTGRVDPMQIIDLKMSQQDIDNEAPYEDLVWGAFFPQYWNQAPGKNPNMILSRYFMPFNDDSVASGHNLTWWQQNHPDWIMYACDSSGNPLPNGQQWVARDDGFPDVPLDIHNPAVIQYQMSVEIPYLKANGYNALAADNITFGNYLGGPNSLLGQNDPGQNYGSDGWYGCGIFDQNNNFVRRYSGPNGNPANGAGYADPNFIADLVNWVEQVEPILHQNGMKLLVNHPIGIPGDPNEQAIVTHVDALTYEASFTNFDRFRANVPEIIQYMQYAQTNHVAYMDVDYFCKNDGSPCEKFLTKSQKEFGIATYELGNEGGAALFMSPSGGQKYSYYPAYKLNIGTPCGEYTEPLGYQALTYARQFSHGYVVVNNNYTGGPTETVTLPSHQYTDLTGRTVTNPLPVAPLDAYVLKTTENGCQ
ncbi:MAG TPA: hypothetical protein VFA29_14120 [Candidatus Baltobacteraceae bacterium]|nr:hypothetical protein [Candidatus Baltobacteraceae bacterium]